MNVGVSNFFESIPGYGADLAAVSAVTPVPGATFLPNPAPSVPAIPPTNVVFAMDGPTAAPPPPAKLPDLGLFLSSLGVTDDESRAELTAQIYSFAFEVGITKITPQLNAAETVSAARIIKSGPVNQETFATFFRGPAREPALQEAFQEALEVVTAVANRPAAPPV